MGINTVDAVGYLNRAPHKMVVAQRPLAQARGLAYLNGLAASEGLDMQAAAGDSTRRGLHAKIILLRIGGETWSAVGSLNGGEISHKINRAVVMADHPASYVRLLEVFLHDWALVAHYE